MASESKEFDEAPEDARTGKWLTRTLQDGLVIRPMGMVTPFDSVGENGLQALSHSGLEHQETAYPEGSERPL